MASTTSRGAPGRSAEALVRDLERQGWHPGVPRHLNDWARLVDERVCRQAVCGQCRRRGLKYRPFYLGCRYRVVGVCPDCGFGEEF